MKGLLICLIVLIFLVSFSSAAIRINEVYPNAETESGGEWIEIYTNSAINLTNWIISDGEAGSNFTFNASLNMGDFLILTYNATLFNETYNLSNISIIEYGINATNLKLANGGDQVFLYNSSNISDSVSWTDDPGESKSLSYCSGNWNEEDPTPGATNDCTIPDPDRDPRIELEWDEDDIVNGDIFEIKVIAEDLDDEKYDIKIWIEDEDEKVISERYNAEEKKWKAGTYYVNEFFDGPGDENDEIKVRIKSGYRSFKGEAIIFVKLRENDGDVEDDWDDDIDIIKAIVQDDDTDSTTTSDSNSDTDNNEENDEPISLGSIENQSQEDLDEKKDNSIIYKSKSEYIKEYAVYGFALLCIILTTLVILFGDN